VLSKLPENKIIYVAGVEVVGRVILISVKGTSVVLIVLVGVDDVAEYES